ncbi:hypothetical protein KC320_g3187, partial [Hortaea werneckii]
TKNAGGTGDEITVQGDVSEDIEEWLLEHYEEKIPEDNIEFGGFGSLFHLSTCRIDDGRLN